MVVQIASPSGPKLQSIQLLRALAALAVLSAHSLMVWSAATHMTLRPCVGAFGVDLFFVISGFIVCQAARRSSSATSFLRARYLRVAPFYYLLSLPFLVGTLATGQPFLAPLATSLFFWPIWGDAPNPPLLTVGWTLCFEALFYISLGAVIKLRQRAAIALLAGYAVALALNAAGARGIPQFLGSPLILEFLLGAVIAWWPVRERPCLGSAAILAGCLLFLFWAVHGAGDTPKTTLAYEPIVAIQRVLVAGVPAFLLVWGALQLEPWCKGRVAAAFAYLGDASYSTYLIHPLLITLAADLFRATGAPLSAMPFVCIAAGQASGMLVYRTIERPLLALLRRKPKSRRATYVVYRWPAQ
jgi:peptidoglycan/LPS O-acetylase OafA/YrhL